MIPLPVAQSRDVELLIKAHHGAILVDAADEQRAERLFEHVAEVLRLPHFVWRAGTGLCRKGPGMQPMMGTETFVGCLRHIASTSIEALYEIRGPGIHGQEPAVLDRMKQLAERFMQSQACFLMWGGRDELPEELAPYSARVTLAEPTGEEYYEYIRDLVKEVSARAPVRLRLNASGLRRLVGMVRGLTYIELRKLMTCALLAEGALDENVFERVLSAKRMAIEQTGVLEYFPTAEGLAGVAGLENLKAWLKQRAVVFQDPTEAAKFGLSPPRGILLLGVQGCGKSLCAKAVAAAWQLPLLRFDPARIYDRYVGQTEKNLAEAMRVAERVAPVVLWIDELEKVFAQGDEDGGVSARLLGTFLGWMQEKKQTVFVVATANDISRLPPEMLRKGRFDEIFFVDLPNVEARSAIARIHLTRRKRDPAEFNLAAIAEATTGFSGAEIEQAIVASLYDCFAQKSPLSTEAVVREIERTRPLSVTMAENIQRLRAWAAERAVPAD